MAEPVSLLAVIEFAWRNKWLIMVSGLLCGGIALTVGLLMTPHYRAQVVVMPVTSDLAAGGGVANLVRGLGGLASLAGIGLNSGSSRDEILEFLRSRSFTTEFLRENNLLPILFEEDWDSKAAQWRVPPDKVPTIGDAYEFFTEEVRSIDEDKKSGIVTLSVTWSDPELAAKWANDMVASANARLREKAIEEAQRSIECLKREGEKTNVVAVQEAIGKLTEEQVKSVMLANVRDEYAFKVIDPAVMPEYRDIVRPRRALMLALGLVMGSLFGMMVAFGREYQSSRR